MKNWKMVRQGDVLAIKIDQEIPSGAEKIESDKGTVLAYGEVTGHAHRLDDTKTELFEHNNQRFLNVKEATNLVHEEHTKIPFAPGVYEIRRQIQYQPEELKFVAD